ncbi:H+-transporting two-sector ATPase, alpha/beta subunit [Oceanicola granulosus HTCC2516]|uniref:H+-transporting two-sector ATPase, alpha/beta subunit n=1 Tax=Oceanicola granulosus (strain ATCC BAA-861 / DSM 15982 / KCTC 12143 / HTCC2516) TaxID=314256 RepID=Q2CDH0_OCEGH|nr:FliI/YscN family ATPase [Oceanicola granulosus]EAR50741.1 H+-transporting two-sector ATPase, alpha/beta subunit [Oceanicola granulosus HTCC2516]
MPIDQIDLVRERLGDLRVRHLLGRVSGVASAALEVTGFGAGVRVGDPVTLPSLDGRRGEVIGLDDGTARVLLEGGTEGISLRTPVRLEPPVRFAPGPHWLGRVIDPDGRPLDGRPLLPGTGRRPRAAPPPRPHRRRPLGARLSTGFAVFDTLLPLVRGQRLGLFAGSGVGKSTLLGDLARGVEADVVVIGLVGERGRELRTFVDEVLGAEGMARAIVVTATSDTAPQVRRRCAPAAMAVAQHFRDTGHHVLLLLDSVTRFAEAHRELAAAQGEPASLRGFPASTAGAIAALCERAGPGEDAGDITAVFSVLVAGSDMEEPVADMLRGVLDGHVILDRKVAERNRFPAIDLLRSVSRALPAAASDVENSLISRARALLGSYDRAEMMIQSGLYASGSDARIDEAIACHDALDGFLAQRSASVSESFAALRRALNSGAR